MTHAQPPSPALQIRRATHGDAAAIAACVAAAYEPWVRIIGMKPGPMHQDYAQVLAEAQAFVAEGEAGIQGVLILRVDREGFLLENVAVHPNAAAHGLGTQLLKLAEREAVAQGHNSIYLYTHERMATNITRYLAHGYTEFARRSEDGFARVFMRKTFGANDA